MGKYTDQASSYKTGIDMFESSIEIVGNKIKEISTKLQGEDSEDALNYYVASFNEDLKGIIDNLKTQASTNAFSIMQKALEIDARIEQELSVENQLMIDENEVVIPKENPSDISDKMGW